MERVLGIDYGMKRIGIARSDLLGITAQPVTTLMHRKTTVIRDVAEVARVQEAARLVIGLPKHMHGEEGDQAAAARAFGAALGEATGLPVEFVDERLTTSAVQRMLSETNMSGGKKRAVVDKLAAVLILQIWLDRKRR